MAGKMSRRIRLAAILAVAGCAAFTGYGIFAAVFSDAVALYQYRASTGQDFQALASEVQAFSSSTVLLVGLLGAGLAICSGTLFWLGYSRRLRLALILAVVGGGLGLAGLITVHLNQRAWILFIADNVFLNLIGAGFTVGGKEILEIIRGKSEAAAPG